MPADPNVKDPSYPSYHIYYGTTRGVGSADSIGDLDGGVFCLDEAGLVNLVRRGKGILVSRV